ncbi:hypothetical protein Ait01nite_095680 [Actinoplanes italicus]|uniref:SWIM zinc finger protein n=1 Tax=Actinoplanes italicus TaxID=113567 RepID=A0A2T0JMS2_9ACTN|nr:SWIM zinc finger family protein [Actinoplanes italicus]PRX08896.1 SWIM zinc finger protein [Actinoplanes italicus]GIE36523.1 hypothetical protein Ait01nite_095680 [Actinoplanes italicus]
MSEVVLAYDRPSRLDGGVLGLGRAGGAGPLPFFDGWAARPGLVAALLLAVAAVARSRYFQPSAARLLDPILTSGDGRLRLESFSSCCGVYARADLLPEALTGARAEPGTTNVDLNQDVRDALSRLGDRDELRLSVGDDGLSVVTRATTAFERKVALPTRWIKGLGEAALAQAGMEVAATAGAAAARRLLTGLPPAGPASAAPWALVPQGRELRFRQVAAAGAPLVGGPFRLREMRPLARHALGLTVWTRPERGPRSTAFQLDLPGARLWLVLSPDVTRGFSGEGQALGALADPGVVAGAEALHPSLAWTARIDENALAASAGVAAERLRLMLAVLGGQGLVGHDLVEQAWFRRDLPFVAGRVAALQPRVRRAASIDASDVTVNPVEGGHEVFVRGRGFSHRVTLIGADARCTCLWFSRHGDARGPCRHVLAAKACVAPGPASASP